MSRFRSALPRFDREARLPLLLTLPLAATLAFQIAAPEEDALPPAGPLYGGRPAQTAGLPAPAVPPAGVAVRAALFTPPPPAPASAGGATGPILLGSVAVGARRFALFQAADGRIARVMPGGRIAGWRLAAIEAGAVRLVHGNDTLRVPFGGRIGTPPIGATGERR